MKVIQSSERLSLMKRGVKAWITDGLPDNDDILSSVQALLLVVGIVIALAWALMLLIGGMSTAAGMEWLPPIGYWPCLGIVCIGVVVKLL